MPLSISSICRNITPSTTLRLNALVAEKRKQGLDVISLAAGEPDFDTPDHIKQAAHEAIDKGYTKYTASSGLPDLRKAICEHIRSTKGLSYQPGEIIVGTGAKQVILGALIALLEPGDEVLLPTPCWLSYPEMVRMAGGVPVLVPTSQEQGFMPDLSQLEAAVTPRTRAILFNSPNNPTGAVWDARAMEAVAQCAKDHDLWILSDEIYETLVFGGGTHIPMASLSEDAYARTITISGLSKTYAMTGWRIGYAAGPKHVIEAMDAYQSHATGNPNTIAQYAALKAVTDSQQCVADMAQAFESRCQAVQQLLREVPGITFAPPQGAFYVMVNIEGLLGKQFRGQTIDNDAKFAELVLEHALVSVVPGEPFFAPGCVRLSYAINEKRLAEAVRRIKAFVEELT